MASRNNFQSSFFPLTLIISLIAVAGSLWLSIGLGLKACPLCFYQRSFAMAVAGILIIGLITGQSRSEGNALAALSLPLAVAGFCVAAFHVYLEFSCKLECPLGILGIGTAPQQSLAILLVLVLLLMAQCRQEVRGGSYRSYVIGVAAILGGLMAYACVVSAPPLPKVPDKAYETPFDTCRPPFKPFA